MIMETRTMSDHPSRDALRIRYAVVGAVIGNVVVFALTALASLAVTPDFGVAFAMGVSAFMAMWAGTAFGVIFGNAVYEARFGHRTDVEDVVADDAEIHQIAPSDSHDRAA